MSERDAFYPKRITPWFCGRCNCPNYNPQHMYCFAYCPYDYSPKEEGHKNDAENKEEE